MTETRFYEPARLIYLFIKINSFFFTEHALTQTLVFTKTAGRHNLVEVIVIYGLPRKVLGIFKEEPCRFKSVNEYRLLFIQNISPILIG